MKSWLYRLGPSAVAAVVFLVFALLWKFDLPLYLGVMTQYIWTDPGSVPFGDTGAVLLAADCWRHGVDVFLRNGCMGGGQYIYSPILLHALGFAGVDQDEQVTIGAALCLLFIAATAFLPPVRTRSEFLLRCVVLCSCAAAHGFEAGNIDLLIFVLILAGVTLMCASFVGRLLAYLLFLLGAALKFYPAVLLVFIMRENRRRLICIGTVLALGAAVVLWRDAAQLSSIFSSVPMGPPFRASFGAVYLPFGLVMLSFMHTPTLLPDGTAFYSALHHPGLPLYTVFGSHFLIIAAIITALRLASRFTVPLAALDEQRRLFLVSGSVILAFCFYITPNYEYRGLYLLFVLPGLHNMAREGGRCARLSLMIIPFLLCERILWTFFEALGGLLPGHVLADDFGIALWLLREGGWWFIIVLFTSMGIAYARMAMTHFLVGTSMITIRKVPHSGGRKATVTRRGINSVTE